jgi:hypothetical protein
MLQRLKRKRGGQPGNRNAVGNQNAVKHGRYSAAAKAERAAWWETFKTEWKEQELRSAEWIASRPQTDYHAICLALELEREQRERDLADAGSTTPSIQGKAPARR